MGRGRKNAGVERVEETPEKQEQVEEQVEEEEEVEEEGGVSVDVEVGEEVVAHAVAQQMAETFVVFNLPAREGAQGQGQGRTDVQWIQSQLVGVPAVYTVEEVSRDPLFAILTAEVCC